MRLISSRRRSQRGGYLRFRTSAKLFTFSAFSKRQVGIGKGIRFRFQRGTGLSPALPAWITLCGELFRGTQTGVSIIKHGQLFPRIPQHGARHLRIHLTGQNTRKGRCVHFVLLDISTQTLAGRACGVGSHTPQIVHKDVADSWGIEDRSAPLNMRMAAVSASRMTWGGEPRQRRGPPAGTTAVFHAGRLDVAAQNA